MCINEIHRKDFRGKDLTKISMILMPLAPTKCLELRYSFVLVWKEAIYSEDKNFYIKTTSGLGVEGRDSG